MQLLQGSPNLRSETFHTDFRIFLAQSPYLKSMNEPAFKHDHQSHIQIQLTGIRQNSLLLETALASQLLDLYLACLTKKNVQTYCSNILW